MELLLLKYLDGDRVLAEKLKNIYSDEFKEPNLEKEYVSVGTIKATLKGGWYEITYSNGFVSWLQKEAFEATFREITSSDIKLIN